MHTIWPKVGEVRAMEGQISISRKRSWREIVHDLKSL